MNKKSLIFLLASILIFIFIFIFALMVGQYSMSISDFFNAIFTSDSAYETQRSIIINLRLPRTLIAGLTGVALSISGLLYQEIFQNKLSSPDLIGVSSGASVGAALAIVLGMSSIFISLFAFLFGVITVLITIIISKLFKNGSSITLILAGIIVGGFMSACLSLIKYFADPQTTLAQITYWLMGSFENSKMEYVYILGPIVLICCVILLLLAWRINIIALGKEEAQSRGLNYKIYRIVFICIATLLTAVSVAFSGTISWIGLVVPHIVRLISGRDTRRSIPLCITFGGVFMIFVDIFSRTFTQSEIPLSAVTGLIGTAVFAIILISRRKNIYVD